MGKDGEKGVRWNRTELREENKNKKKKKEETKTKAKK